MATFNRRTRLAQVPSPLFLLILCSLLFNGCAVQEVGRSISQSVKGDYYLQTENYERGLEGFRAEVEKYPESAVARYYYGRFLLLADKVEPALTQLEAAVALAPQQAEYHFWAGYAEERSGNHRSAQQRYEETLSLRPDHLQALLYLGHNRFAAQHDEEALILYTRVLQIWPSSPSALYNRAVILQRHGRTAEERQAWLHYLVHYPAGSKARYAADSLNALGDFSFRNHRLAARTVTLEQIRFKPFSADLLPASYDSLRVVGSITRNRTDHTLQIVAYQNNNEPLARQKAQAVKQFLLTAFPGLESHRIGVSWFGVSEEVTVLNKKQVLDEAIVFFTVPISR